LQRALQAVVDAGACPAEPTTVIDLSAAEPVVVRRGRGDPARRGLVLAPALN
jgi:tRNA A37 threonylcarbamoyladenosine synthetase subunit TsaC/SUA5/YrdC